MDEITALESVRYDAQTGLVPVVVQNVETGQVLMLAYANREALKRTFATGLAWFWSRSRSEYWQKGAVSGNVQHVVDVRLDCDGDTVLYLVRPQGPACHTGNTSCFFRKVTYKGEVPGPASAQPAEGAKDSAAAPSSQTQPAEALHSQAATEAGAATSGVLERLWTVLDQRWESRPQGSYTTFLFEQGMDKVAKKVGEDAVEVAIAAKNAAVTAAGRVELAEESADLLYHLWALWKTAGIAPSDVYEVLARREQ